MMEDNTMTKTVGTNATPAPSLGLAWLFWAIAASFFLYQFILRVVIGSISDDLVATFNISASELGGLAAAAGYGYAFFQIPSGIVTDKIGPKAALLIAVFLAAAGTYVFSNTDSYTVAWWARFVTGIGAAFSFVCCAKIAANWFPPHFMTSVLSMTVFLGATGAVMGGAIKNLAELFPWRDIMLYLAYFGGVIALLTMFLKDKPSTAVVEEPEADPNQPNLFVRLLKVMMTPQILIISLLSFFLYLPLGIIGDMWGQPFVENVLVKNGHSGFSATGYIYAALAAGSVFFGWWTTKYDKAKFLLYFMGATLTGSTFLFTYGVDLFNSAYMVALMVIISGFVMGAINITFTLGTLNAERSLSATVVGVVNTATMLSTPIFQTVYGSILESYDPVAVVNGAAQFPTEAYQNAMLMLPIAMALVIVIAFFVKNKKTLQ